MSIGLHEHFTFKKLFKFTIPTIIMMLFTSIYGVVDGIFVSNFAGTTAFAGVNLILPFIYMLAAIGFMIGAGGSAIISKSLGEGNVDKANNTFSMLIYVTLAFGSIVAMLGIIFIRPIAILLGAQGEMIDICVTYGRIYLMALPIFMLQYEFQSFLVVAEKAPFGLAITVCAGVTNMVLDALFLGVFGWGVSGAALATATSQLVGGGIPLVYFIICKKNTLKLGRAKFDGKTLFKTCTNGSSELMTNISMSLVNMLYNSQLMKFMGENGVAAYGVIMYVAFVFAAMFIGYSIGVAPVISFHFGAKNSSELHNLLKKSLSMVFIMSVVLVVAAELLAPILSGIFVSYNEELLILTTRAFRIYSISFIISGFNIFGSAFFTALSNGVISAVISFLRTLVFQSICILVLPLLFGAESIWSAIIIAEILASIITVVCILKLKRKYNY